MRGRVLALLFVFVTALLPFGGSVARADDGLPIDMDEVDECFGGVPHLPLDVMRGTITSKIVVARDGVSEKAVRSLMAKIGKIYAPTAGPHPLVTPDVRFKIVAIHDLTKVLKGREVSGFVVESKPKGKDLMSQLIRYYRAKYPKLARHHVHLFTDRNITQVPVGDPVAGIANCIGGIGTKYGYSIGEVGVLKPIELGPLTAYKDVNVKVSAHEIGHVFGAQHHYMNCIEGIPTAVAQATPDACTLMSNFADFAGSRFGIVESLAVRGFAEAHIARTNPLPERLPLPELPPILGAEIPVPAP
jgi:hypothetical protein